MRLSRAVETPLWIRTARFATKLFSGHPMRRTKNPANAETPSSLEGNKGYSNVHMFDRGKDLLVKKNSGNDYLEWCCPGLFVRQI